MSAQNDAPQAIRGAMHADQRAVHDMHALTELGSGVPKLETGIPGFDYVAMGGLPCGRVTVVCGAAGSAKTVFAGQFLAEGARRGQPGVFVTMEEPADDLRRNLATIGLDIGAWEEAGDWAFVDGSPALIDDRAAAFHLDTLLAQIEHAVDAAAATRVAIDSLAAVLALEPDVGRARQQLRTLLGRLRRLGLTVVLTAEGATDGEDVLTAAGVEQFVADNVVVLRNTREEEKRRRTVEILKMRGAAHRRGEYPFTVMPAQGIVVLPISIITLDQASGEDRAPTGSPDLDPLVGGGWFKDSIVLVSGATGTGKTLMVTEFLAGALEKGERCLLFAFEESRDQIYRNATGWGRAFADHEAAGTFQLVASYPEVASLEDHLVEIKQAIDTFRPTRIAIDSLSALERVGTVKGFREFLIGLTSFVKANEVTAMFTAATSSLLGGSSTTETHISTLTDAIVLLRYVEVAGEVKRALTVLKMRGSSHDHDIHEYRIDGEGMHVVEPLRSVGGILSGNVVNLSPIGANVDDILPPELQ